MQVCIVDERDRSLPWLRGALPAATIVTHTELGRSVRVEFEQSAGSPHDPASSGGHLDVGGRSVAAADISAVYCRLPLVTVEHLGFDDVDDEYATAEWNALLLAWLAHLGPRAVNRPWPYGLAGRWACTESWSIAASLAGLAAETSGDDSPPAQHHDGDDVIVLGDRVLSHVELSNGVTDGLVRLTESFGARVMGYSARHGWDTGPIVDLTGNPCPLLTATGEVGRRALQHLVTAIGFQHAELSSMRSSAGSPATDRRAS